MGKLQEYDALTGAEANDKNIYRVDKYVSGTEGVSGVYETKRVTEGELKEVLGIDAVEQQVQTNSADITTLDGRVTQNETEIAGLSSGYRGALYIADTPTLDGIYTPIDEGTYPNAGGLIYSPTTTDEGFDVTFILTGGVWSKKRVEVGDLAPINEAIMDVTRTIIDGTSTDWIDGFAPKTSNGVLTAQADKCYQKIENIELGNYETSSWMDAYGTCLYDKNGVFLESFVSGSVGDEVRAFTISNPEAKTLLVTTLIARKNTFYLKKKNSTFAKNKTAKTLGVKDLPNTTIWVSKLGNDTNSGIKSKPFLTINKAIDSLSPLGGIIVVRGGDYYETLDLDSITSGNVSLISFDSEKVRIMGSDKIQGFSKTTGRTKIYEATFSGVIEITGGNALFGKRIFEDGVPSLEIPLSERNALQRSQNHRLPYSEIREIPDQGNLSDNLDFLDALPLGESGYYQDTFNNKIYVVNALHGDITATSIHFAVRKNTNSNVFDSVNFRDNVELSIRGLEFYYSTEKGLDLYRFGKVNLWRVSVFGARQNGIDEQGSDSEMVMCEAAGCGRDGIASQLYYVTPNGGREKERFNKYENIWLHDNYDDGFSTHQNGANSINNFLFEYNGDTGYQNVGTTYCILSNGISRNNGSGVVINGAAPANHTRNSTTLDAYNVISSSNRNNFDCDSDTGLKPAVMNLFNCISRNSTNIGFRKKGVNAIVNANNCKSSGDNISQDGVVIINDSELI